MQRITITVDDELMAAVDRLIGNSGYQNRSEAIRDLARTGLAHMPERDTGGNEAAIAALVYVYDHAEREMAKRLTRSFHDHHDLSLATLHVHLDHESCMEVAVLKGGIGAIRDMARHVCAERGVRHGQLVTVPVAIEAEAHRHGDGEVSRHEHVHVREAG